MKILITGATGFIGSALVKAYESPSNEIIIVTRNPVEVNEGIVFFLLDSISASTDWMQVLSGVDVVIHLAARNHVMKDSSADPLKDFLSINTHATLNLAEQCAAAGVSRFLFLSSIKVNGEITFNDKFTSKINSPPTDPYAFSKYKAEQGLLDIAKNTKLDVVIIRPPLVYGENVKGNFNQLLRLINYGLPLPLGSINNKRSLVALENLISLITVCVVHEAAVNQVFLISDDDDLSTTELLIKLSKAMNNRVYLLRVPQSFLSVFLKLFKRNSVERRIFGNLQVDISHTKNILGWQPIISADDALFKTAQAWISQKSNEKS